MWFNGWQNLLRIVLVGMPAYLALLLLLRIGGKRTLSKFNAFDLVVTVAFGSALSAGLLNRDIALAEIILAFALLVGLQFAITFSMLRWPRLEGLVKHEPRLVFRNGEFLTAARCAANALRTAKWRLRSARVGSAHWRVPKRSSWKPTDPCP